MYHDRSDKYQSSSCYETVTEVSGLATHFLINHLRAYFWEEAHTYIYIHVCIVYHSPHCNDDGSLKVLLEKNMEPRPWFSIKMSFYQYRKSHRIDKAVIRSSYFHNGISYIGKMAS